MRLRKFWMNSLLAGAAMLGPILGLGAGTAHAAGMTKLNVVLGYIPDVEMYGPEYALKQGYYKAEGLNVTLIPAGQGVDQIQMVAAGIAQIGIANPEQILAGIGQGEKFKVFAGQFQTQPIAMTCRKDSGVTKPADLVGKTVGVKVNADPYFKLFLSKNGVPADKVKTTTIGPNDVSLLIAGRIACEITTFAFNEPLIVQQAGVPTTVLPLGDYGLNSQVDSFFVKDTFFSKPGNEAVLVKFMRATAKGWVSFYKDPKAAANWIIDGNFVDGLDRTQQVFQAEQQVKFMKSPLTAEKGIFWLDPKIWAETDANLVAAGVNKSLVPLDGLLTTSILEQADMPKF
ncbi:ABC transporter substrate-binding protein [Acidisoma cellulosilytica]|uniref:Thiamine pyrimidine synthase n=1 Tax=Acidisoma cellulosilyticum TaxID=2802395 RepID=A0A964E4L0_9PROT|nr:ABC transporter substrate-binding protein [Acidisoma cellulosilyticum]MCB8881594.1 ABC transporter substrate-binding protein [Acidisoma cellulosilyticum]